MMKGFSEILALFVLVLMSSACNPFDVEEVLLSREDISLTWRGNDQIVYDPLTWQIGYNDRTYEYRVNDDAMADYYIVRCDARLSSEGQEVYADVEWTVKSNIKRYEHLKFTVRKVGTDGRIWLWNRSQNIGVIVKVID